jgi:hypothetical protein
MVTVVRERSITVTEVYYLHVDNEQEALMVALDPDILPDPALSTEEANNKTSIVSMIPVAKTYR